MVEKSLVSYRDMNYPLKVDYVQVEPWIYEELFIHRTKFQYLSWVWTHAHLYIRRAFASNCVAGFLSAYHLSFMTCLVRQIESRKVIMHHQKGKKHILHLVLVHILTRMKNMQSTHIHLYSFIMFIFFFFLSLFYKQVGQLLLENFPLKNYLEKRKKEKF